ncbi:S-layer homology domain-containing protein [Paenibacillus alvei]|uniref:S-layer homology domain-containing protein n=2 Tax=Paenibacillus TaxID=44249 RepID=A0ABT4GVH3_PAEAL|nr:S-layer homology domain-containing protein [Paenibacillus alvei]MCY9760691.1 S-layer homology domain-containing protein [Paenibacillus alvei]MCY9765930.1 S-layer homology domain-containing protein [Paenibacillus alvei]
MTRRIVGWGGIQEENDNSKVLYTDLSGHWAQQAALKWSKRGVVQGNEAQSFVPNRMVTRAEWAALLGRMFQPQPGKQPGFIDVAEKNWYTQDIAAAVNAGYMKGHGTKQFKPQETLTRQEAEVSLQTIMKLASSERNLPWKDSKRIATWAQAAVAAVTEQGLMKGYADSSFRPNQGITRAEAITLLDRVFDAYGTWIGAEGVHGPTTGEQQLKGTVFINAAGVTLQNTVIDGDLIIGKQVGEGDVHLKNVKVKGNTYVYGGGDHNPGLGSRAISLGSVWR